MRITFGGLHRTIKVLLLCTPPKWDAPYFTTPVVLNLFFEYNKQKW